MNEPPVVEQMILCDEVRVHPGKLKKWDIIGLVFRFRSSKKERPIRMPRLSVFLRLANGRGEGEGRSSLWNTTPAGRAGRRGRTISSLARTLCKCTVRRLP